MYRRFINKSKFKYITDRTGGGGTLSICRRYRRLASLFSMCELVGLRIPLSLSISFSALQVSRRLSYLRRVIRIEISLNALRTKDVILGVWAKATRTIQIQNHKVLLETCSILAQCFLEY